jgi:glycerol-1-phosphatase
MRRVATALISCERPPAIEYDVALLDLDGVVYVGRDAVPEAASALREARGLGMRLAFVTNNAARTPADVAAHLSDLDVGAEPSDVVTSAQAAAHYLADRVPPNSRVLVVGTTGLEVALRERGLVPVSSAEDDPVAVVQGYSPDLTWHQLAEGTVAILRGLPWVATNLDPTVPSPRGPLPGNGSMVAALRYATGRTPIATGKPDPTMHQESVQRSGAQRPIVVGDRLDTDIEGATAVGCPSMLVMTGVTTARDLVAARPRHRPSLIAPDLRGLLTGHPGVERVADGFRCRQWTARVVGTDIVARRDIKAQTSSESMNDTDDRLDVLRAICGASWAEDDGERLTVRGADEASRDAIAALGF